MPSTRVRPWTIIAVLWFAYFINYADRQLIFSQFPVLTHELGFTATQLGLIGSVFLWVYSLTSPLAGRFADRVRLEWLIPASLVLWSLATLGTGFSRSVPELLIWRGLIGVTEGLYFPAALAAIGAVHSGETRSRAIAIHGSAQFAGSIAGGWFGGWAAEYWTWRAGYFFLSAVGVLYAPLLRRGLRPLPARNSSDAGATSTAEVLGSARLRALTAAFFFLCAILWMLYAWLPSLVHERFRLSLTESGFLSTAYLQASSAAGILAGGVIGDWCARQRSGGRFWIVAGGLLLCSPFAYLTVATSSLVILKVAATGFGLFAGLMTSNVVASAYDVTDPRNYGFVAGILTLLGGLSGGLSMLTAGRWKDSIGVETLMGWTALAAVVSSLILAATLAPARLARPQAE